MATLTEPQPTGQQPNIKPVDTVAGGSQPAELDLRDAQRVQELNAKAAMRDQAAQGNITPPEGGGFDVSKPPATPNAVPISTQTNPFKLEATEQSESAEAQGVPTAEPVAGAEQVPQATEDNSNHTIAPDAGAPQPGEAPAAAPQPEANDPAGQAQPAAEKPKRKKFLGLF